MTQIHWKNAVSADFNTKADWSTGTVPGAGDDAILDASGKVAYTVTASTSETVNSIQTASTATLSITSGTFTATAGTGTGANAGTILVGNNTIFSVGGALANSGLISLASGGNITELFLAAKTTLSGGGKVTLTDNANNLVFGAAPFTTLTNVDNTISGAGQLGNGQMTLVNQTAGVINAIGNNALVVNTAGRTVTNGGLMEGSGAGGLSIVGTTVDDSGGGVIKANNASRVLLTSADIIGGFLQTQGSGVVATNDRGSELDGTASAVTNQGALQISNNTSLTVEGTIKNTGAGKISLASGGNITQLIVGAKDVTLSGGTISLSDTSANQIIGTLSGARGSQTVSTLTNGATIAGSGAFGANLALVNTGTVDATGGSALILATGNAGVAGSNLITNSGLLESTNPLASSSLGGLLLQNVVVADGTAGIIKASGLHTHVDLASATIRGGTLTTANGGVIQSVDRGSVLDGTTDAVAITGTVQVSNNTSLTVQGAINQSGAGKINFTGGGNITQLIVGAQNATLTGGSVVLNDFAANQLIGTLTGPRGSQVVSSLTNNTLISGAGTLGTNLTLTNTATGVVDATGGNALILATGNAGVAGSNVVANSGLLESTNPFNLSSVGGLVISKTTIANAATGVIEANGLHTHVDLQTATIQGGTLTTAAGGVIDTIDRGSLLDGNVAAVANTGEIDINNNTSLTARGTLTNSGSVKLGSVGNVTDFIIGADTTTPAQNNLTLKGGGSVVMSDNSQNRLYGASAGAILTNVDNTISGAGQLGAGQLILVNKAAGVINATGNTNALVLNVGTVAVANSGLIEASGAGGLSILNSTVDNSTGGSIAANNGSSVGLTNATIIGGTLSVTGTGFFQTGDTLSVLNGATSAVTNAGLINIANNTALTLQGTIANTGAIALNSVGNLTDLIIDVNNVTLNGAGQITLSNNGQNRIYGATAAATLTNVNDTISGAGQIGVAGAGSGPGGLTLINKANGVIDASAVTALVINLGANALVNSGLIEATGSGGLAITTSTIDDTSGGSLMAGDGSFVTLTNATIIGGALKGAGTGFYQTGDTLSVLNGQAVAINNLSTININNNTALTLQGAITNGKHSAINLNSVGNVTDLIIDVSNATLSGGGAVTLSNNAQNRIYGATAATTLTNIDNKISGSGQIGVAGAGSGPGSLTLINQAKGIIDGTQSAALTLDTGTNVITNAGFIQADTGGTTIINSALKNTGTVEANGGLLEVNAAISGNGKAVITKNGGTLEFTQVAVAQAVSFKGSIGTLRLDHSQTYTGTVTGFSTSFGTQFDLSDIVFNGSTMASYSGNTTGGVLTVTDGTHAAHITLVGDYTSSTFDVSNDGHGGTFVTDPAKAATAAAAPTRLASVSAPSHQFIAAMAGLGGDSGGPVPAWMPSHGEASRQGLFSPRAHAA